MVTKQQFQPPSTEFLKALGYNFSRDLLCNDYMLPENYLWRAVVINALEDTMIKRNDRKSSTLKTNAHNWILNELYSFDLICNWAMLDPENVVYAYKKALNDKHIIFTNVQLYWHKYNVLSKKFRNSVDIRVKSNIKNEMRKIRVKANSCTVIITEEVNNAL